MAGNRRKGIANERTEMTYITKMFYDFESLTLYLNKYRIKPDEIIKISEGKDKITLLYTQTTIFLDEYDYGY